MTSLAKHLRKYFCDSRRCICLGLAYEHHSIILVTSSDHLQIVKEVLNREVDLWQRKGTLFVVWVFTFLCCHTKYEILPQKRPKSWKLDHFYPKTTNEGEFWTLKFWALNRKFDPKIVLEIICEPFSSTLLPSNQTLIWLNIDQSTKSADISLISD